LPGMKVVQVRVPKALFVAMILLIAMAIAVQASAGLKCSACGRPIGKEYFKTDGRYYHPWCFRCAYCNKPIKGSYIHFKGKNYHSDCYRENVALKCGVCGGIIQGEYITDYWGDKYHPWHEGRVVQCDFCGRFIVGDLIRGMVRFRDGRFLCARCAPSAVRDAKEAKRLAVEVAARLRRYGIAVDAWRIDFKLVGRDKLKKLSDRPSYDTTGFVDYAVEKNLFGKVKSQRIKIYLLEGMPRIQAAAAVAHELAHVWQFKNCRLKLEKTLSEGSANYAAALVLREIGGPEARFIIDRMEKNEDPVYGDGYRKVRKYVERKGVKSWLNVLKRKDVSISSLAP